MQKACEKSLNSKFSNAIEEKSRFGFFIKGATLQLPASCSALFLS
jgi:hypothetical protein